MKKKILTGLILFLIFALAFFIRVYFSYSQVFSNPIKYSSDDGIYQMRLVENELLGGHFPKRINFDAFVYFPYGTYLSIAPLYHQILAFFIWLISFGKPTIDIINKVAPFYPPFLGSLLIFLVYFLAKKIWDRPIAFCSSLLIALAIFPQRSILGDNDTHIGEVFFSTLAMMFLFFTLKARKNKELKIEENLSLIFWQIIEDFKQERKFWFFTILTGFSLGLYFLAWQGALLFLFIFFVFINLYFLIKYIVEKPPYWILLMGATIFLITLLTIAPFLNWATSFYKIKYISSLIIGILVFFVVTLISAFIEKKRMNKWLFFVFLLLTALLFLVVLKISFPLIFQNILESFEAINTSMASNKFLRTITGEMQPIGLMIFSIFDYFFVFSIISFVIVFYKFIKEKKEEDFLLLIWTVIITLISGMIPFFGQIRFSYYLSIIIALFSSFFIIKGLKSGWSGLSYYQELSDNSPAKNYILIGSLATIFGIILLLFNPFPTNFDKPFPWNTPIIFQKILANNLFIASDDWYKTLQWLKDNTPEPGVDYYAFYKEPEVDGKSGKMTPYNYPQQAYGVLTAWDFGNLVAFYSHRIPNSNNMQLGIGKKNEDGSVEPGETTFFIETDESKAIRYLDSLRTKYIITNSQLADPGQFFMSKVLLAQGNYSGYLKEQESKTAPNLFDNSMIVRLHLLDGKEKITKRKVDNQELDFYIKPLDHFRLIYESPTTVSYFSQDLKNEIKEIKIFEYVKGAKIMGKTRSNIKISISTQIKTNQEREFLYEKSIEAKDGYFEFVVPYSTYGKEGWLPDQTQFSVFAQPYKLKIGNIEKIIRVSEEDVLEGNVIRM